MDVQFSAAEKDALARLLLLNSHIDAQNQAYFKWKEPFNTLLMAAKAAHKKEGSSSYDKPSSTMGCSGEAEHSFLETPKMVAKVLYDNTNHIHYVLPTIKQHDMIAIMSKVDYIL